jgi:hypothetical protein
MAIHHPTPPLGGGERPRLPSAQVGPVTQAIRAMRAPTFDVGKSDHAPRGGAADQAIAAIKDGLATFFAEINAVKSGISAFGKPGDFRFQDHGTRAMPAIKPVPHTGFAAQFTHGIRALSRTEVENLVEGLIDLLDGCDGDADREFEEPEASATEWTGCGAHRFNVGRAA